MRMLMKVVIPNEGGNKAVKEGTVGKIIGQFTEQHRPEASYFLTENGERMAMFVLDVKDPSEMVVLGEPFFMGLNARCSLAPVMNAQDLKTGLEKVKF